MRSITLHLPKGIVDVIDKLVESGLYLSRAHAMRSMLLRQLNDLRAKRLR